MKLQLLIKDLGKRKANRVFEFDEETPRTWDLDHSDFASRFLEEVPWYQKRPDDSWTGRFKVATSKSFNCQSIVFLGDQEPGTGKKEIIAREPILLHIDR